MNLRETPMSFPYKADRDELLKKWQHVIDQTERVWSWTSGHELAWLCELASISKSICEIGSHHGKSALCMALANPKCSILSIDICDNPEVEPTFAKNLSNQIAVGQVAFFKGTSALLNGIDISPTLKFDATFIDGGHMAEDVRSDIKNLRPRMKPNAIMAGHDWREHDMSDGVNRAVVEAFGRPDGVFQSVWWVKI